MSFFNKNDNNVEEEVLFNISNSLNGDNDVEEEVLFRNDEDIDFIEPVKPVTTDDNATGSEVLFSGRNAVSEVEILDNYSDVDDGTGSEVLFNFDDEGDTTETLTLSGEDIDFVEPIKPTNVEEEVLFGNIAMVDNTAVNTFETAGGIIAEDLLSGILDDDDDKKVYVDKNFAQKMLEADSEILQRYLELKNVILAYKKVKSRISNNFDSFNMGRTQLFKLCTSGKSLKLYLNLNYEEVETRLKCKYVGDKKSYAEVPVFLRIKSPRAFRNAKYLIEKVAQRFNLEPNKKFVPVDGLKLLQDKFDVEQSRKGD